jgi:uncharacterized membrane protein YeaQ/YmgE (transglycosylase-associated protein family)
MEILVMSLIVLAAALIVIVMMSLVVVATASLIHLALYLFIAGLVGALADALVPGRLPWGWLGAVAAGLVGSWLGAMLIGRHGPVLFGLPLFSAFVGALILAFAIAAVGRLQTRKS